MEKTSTAIAKFSSVPDAISLLAKKLEELKFIETSSFKTKKQLDCYNLETETNLGELVKMLSSVRAREKAYNDAQSELAKELGGEFSIPQFKLEGSTADEWAADILLRIKIIQQKETYNKLTALKKEAEDLLDKEDKKALLLKKLESL